MPRRPCVSGGRLSTRPHPCCMHRLEPGRPRHRERPVRGLRARVRGALPACHPNPQGRAVSGGGVCAHGLRHLALCTRGSRPAQGGRDRASPRYGSAVWPSSTLLGQQGRRGDACMAAPSMPLRQLSACAGHIRVLHTEGSGRDADPAQLTHAHARTRARTHTRMHARARARTHTHTRGGGRRGSGCGAAGKGHGRQGNRDLQRR